MPGYSLFVALHVLAGVVALVGFWSAALMKKGSPRHRALGKVYLLAMAAIVATALPITVEYAVFRRQPLSALFLAYLMALTGNAAWLAWRAVTDKRDWKRLVARIGWKLALWPMLLLALTKAPRAKAAKKAASVPSVANAPKKPRPWSNTPTTSTP